MNIKPKSKLSLLLILSCVYVGCLIVANTATGKTLDVFGFTWTSMFIVFPIIYIINDVLAECYGFQIARKVIFVGFGVNLLAVVVYQIALALPGSPFFTEQAAFETVLGTTFRACISSFAGYLIGSTLNAKIMQIMHDRDGEPHLMRRCLLSSFAGELADAAVFNICMFSFVLPWYVIAGTIITYGLAKVAYEVIVYPVTQFVIKKVKALPEQ